MVSMRKLILVPALLCSLCLSSARGASAQSAVTPPQASTGGAEILSDTKGVDFSPYLREVMKQINRQWNSLIPPEAKSPTFAKGEASIRFSIAPDGTITTMHLDSSSHDEQINRACWGAITGVGHFASLPEAFKGPSLTIRLHFLVNMTRP